MRFNGHNVNNETQPRSTGHSLVDERDVDPMEGRNPPEKWSVAQGYANTPLEEQLGSGSRHRRRRPVTSQLRPA